MQSFGHHLRANQYVHLVLRKLIDYALMSIFLAGGVKVHSCYTCTWEQRLYLFFQSFCAKSLCAHLVLAFRTHPRHACAMTAAVTYQTMRSFVVGHTHIAIRTFGHLAAVGALQVWRITSSVLKQYHLFAFSYLFADTKNHRIGKVAIHLFSMVLTLQIHHSYSRQLQSFETLSHLHQSILTTHRVVVALHRRCSCS